MKKSDKGVTETLKFSDVCTVDADGSITVTIPQVTGDITINAAAKRQLTTLNVEGLTAGGAKAASRQWMHPVTPIRWKPTAASR